MKTQTVEDKEGGSSSLDVSMTFFFCSFHLYLELIFYIYKNIYFYMF